MFETKPFYETVKRNARRVAPAFLFLALLPACSDDKPPKTMVTLNYDKLSVDGKTCQDGKTPRPCAAPLHSEPNYESESVTKAVVGNDGQLRAEWPHEGYHSPADAFEIVCQAEGAEVHDAFGHTSKIWDKGIAPVEHVDPSALERIKRGELKIGVVKDSTGKITGVNFFTPEMWVGNIGTTSQLPDCTPQ